MIAAWKSRKCKKLVVFEPYDEKKVGRANSKSDFLRSKKKKQNSKRTRAHDEVEGKLYYKCSNCNHGQASDDLTSTFKLAAPG